MGKPLFWSQIISRQRSSDPCQRQKSGDCRTSVISALPDRLIVVSRQPSGPHLRLNGNNHVMVSRQPPCTNFGLDLHGNLLSSVLNNLGSTKSRARIGSLAHECNLELATFPALNIPTTTPCVSRRRTSSEISSPSEDLTSRKVRGRNCHIGVLASAYVNGSES